MVAQLHHERIARSDASPTQWLALTHGIYGAGMNWRGIARQLVDRRRDWGVVLVDLRLHGRSTGGEPPHTIAACADDVAALCGELGDIRALAGHSFGGKVMLAARDRVAVDQTWLLDSSPVARGAAAIETTGAAIVLDLLDRLPRVWARRDEFVAALVAAGQGAVIATWLGTNVVAAPDGTYVMRLDTAGVRALLTDYFEQDLWASAMDPTRGALHVVIAERSDTIDTATRARLDAAPPHVHVHRVPADHWLHVEAPAAVVELFAAGL